ncbi:MAG: glycerate kinase [Pseudomonadota bacterium]
MNGHSKARGAQLIEIATRAIAAADPGLAVRKALPEPPAAGRVVVFAFGKAAVPMAAAVEDAWSDLNGRLSGLAVAPGEPASLNVIETIAAAHPEQDERSEAAARRMLDLANGLSQDDFALVLVSGGGSALLCAPIADLGLPQKKRITADLLASGATIHEINTVRKHISALKGGRLAAAIHPAQSLTLAISDVPGDDPAVIASGPTVPDPTTLHDAVMVLEKYRIERAHPPALTLPDRGSESVARAARAERVNLRGLEKGQETFRYVDTGALWISELPETPKPGDPVFETAQYQLIGAPRLALDVAIDTAKAQGFEPVVLGYEIEGEARELGAAHAQEALSRLQTDGPLALISGGELTVTLSGQGRGGPNREYALALALGLAGSARVHALAVDTDGADGAPTEDGSPVAGATVFPDTLDRAGALGLDAAASLADNDAGGFFSALGDDLRPGLTGTNVNDLRVILIDPS